MALQPLRDRHILVVEDDYFLAEHLRRCLLRAGARVLGPVPSIDLGLELIDATPAFDAAVLDLNRGDEMSFPIADALIERDIPFVFTSGRMDGVLGARYPQVLRCDKPFEFEKLEYALASVLQPAAPTTR